MPSLGRAISDIVMERKRKRGDGVCVGVSNMPKTFEAKLRPFMSVIEIVV